MIYGCIGERLSHSFSKEIHNILADYPYELCEVARDKLDAFATKRDFKAINVTIPYKELIIPHLYRIDEHARAIGAVNTVVNRDGLLWGYNTDFYGLSELLRHAGVDVTDKKVLILGTGGTSKTALAVTKSLGAREILRVSRTEREGAISYEEMYRSHTDAEVIINTSPKGMYPDCDGVSVDIASFDRLTGVIDAIYNPLRTRLVSDALARGIAAEGGLYMLVAQGVRASEIFLDTKYPDGECDRVYRKILGDKENIVLIGMPASGKTTVGAILAALTGREVIDTDEEIVKASGRQIPEIFATDGEQIFRDMESAAVAEAAKKTQRIISTGGGAILRRENVYRLKQNGRVFFIDRPLDMLLPTADRPLSKTRDAIEKRYSERYGLYSSLCDVRIDADTSAENVAKAILKEFCK